jgi:PleD family two-component response regulator
VSAFVLNDRRAAALVVSADATLRERLAVAAEQEGCLTVACASPAEALDRLAEAAPDLLLLDAGADAGEPLGVLRALRREESGAGVPAVVLTGGDSAATVAALAAGADDVIDPGVPGDELRARLRVRLDRPPVPRRQLATDPVTGALTEGAFQAALENETERVARGGRPGTLAFVSFHELPALHAELGSRARDELLAQVVRLIKADGR